MMYPASESLCDSVKAMLLTTSIQKVFPYYDYARSRVARQRRIDRLLTVFVLLVLLTFYHMYWKIILPHRTKSQHDVNIVNGDGSQIPKQIWQIFLTQRDEEGKQGRIERENLVNTPSWLAENPNYQYSLVGSEGGDEFVRRHFRDSWLETYLALKNPGLKSDLLRYLILLIKGGVYTDIDTDCVKPIDLWVPEEYRNKTRVVVGLEFDGLGQPHGPEFLHEVQFCQWTIAAAPGHPLLAAMAARAVSSLGELAVKHNTLVIETASSLEVMNSTGPAAWTEVVFKQLQLADPDLTDTRNLSRLATPRLYDDILVLPIDGFAIGLPHSNSGSKPEQALIRHHFRGSWRSFMTPEVA